MHSSQKIYMKSSPTQHHPSEGDNKEPLLFSPKLRPPRIRSTSPRSSIPCARPRFKVVRNSWRSDPSPRHSKARPLSPASEKEFLSLRPPVKEGLQKVKQLMVVNFRDGCQGSAEHGSRPRGAVAIGSHWGSLWQNGIFRFTIKAGWCHDGTA